MSVLTRSPLSVPQHILQASVASLAPVTPHAGHMPLHHLRRLNGLLVPLLWMIALASVASPAALAQRAGSATVGNVARRTVPLTSAVTRQDTSRFRHDRHAALECVTCHAAGSRRGGVITASARDCAGCHHADSEAGRECARCHDAAELAPPRFVSAQLALSVWPAPRSRTLGFEHPRHEKIACAECHAADRERTLLKSCASCHADHHQATRSCASCHPSALEQHSTALHVSGCATSGCHVRETSAAVTPARNVCLACHTAQSSHKPGRECATCHLSQWRAGAPGGR